MSGKSSSVGLAIAATAAAAAIGLFAYHKMQKQKEVAPTTKIYASKADVAEELCSYVAAMAKKSIDARGVFHLAVAGGSLLDLLGKLSNHKDSVDFSKVVLSFANHKCVDPKTEKATIFKSKAKFADAAGITNFIAPTSVVVEGSGGLGEATFYAKALKEAGVPHSDGYPVIDLILLGLGVDGHVGSCHPMGPAVLNTSNAVAASPKDGEPSSITFTIETMNTARQVAVVVCGGSKGKKEAVKRAMIRPAESPRGTFPAQLLKSPLFFLDAEAAADL